MLIILFEILAAFEAIALVSNPEIYVETDAISIEFVFILIMFAEIASEFATIATILPLTIVSRF